MFPSPTHTPYTFTVTEDVMQVVHCIQSKDGTGHGYTFLWEDHDNKWSQKNTELNGGYLHIYKNGVEVTSVSEWTKIPCTVTIGARWDADEAYGGQVSWLARPDMTTPANTHMDTPRDLVTTFTQTDAAAGVTCVATIQWSLKVGSPLHDCGLKAYNGELHEDVCPNVQTNNLKITVCKTQRTDGTMTTDQAAGTQCATKKLLKACLYSDSIRRRRSRRDDRRRYVRCQDAGTRAAESLLVAGTS